MIITRPSHPNPSHSALTAFRTGASIWTSFGEAGAALWLDSLPDHDGLPVVALGNAMLPDSAQSHEFLQNLCDFVAEEMKRDCLVVGPMNGNTWMPHRLVVESNGRPPFMMEPTPPAHWQGLFRAAGFEQLSRYSSGLIDLNSDAAFATDFTAVRERLKQSGVTIRPVDPSRFEDELRAIHGLCLAAFANNFLYTDIDEATFLRLYLKARAVIDPELVLIAERDGSPVGFVFTLPDPSAPDDQPTLVVKTLAVAPERDLRGLGSVLVDDAQRKANEKGFALAIHALQHENNQSLRVSHRFGAEIFRRYALMAKKITV